MSELVSGLERMGYVERVVDPKHRRARPVRLIFTGCSSQRVALRAIAQIETAWLSRLGREAGHKLSAVLTSALLSASAAHPIGAGLVR